MTNNIFLLLMLFLYEAEELLNLIDLYDNFKFLDFYLGHMSKFNPCPFIICANFHGSVSHILRRKTSEVAALKVAMKLHPRVHMTTRLPGSRPG